MLIMTIFQAIVFHAVRTFPWFTPFVHSSDTAYKCYENYSVFCISMFQYITMVIIYSRGKPYRKAIYTNVAFIVSIILLTIVCTYITIYPAEWIVNLLELMVPPVYDWNIIIVALALMNFVVCIFVEMFVIEYLIDKKLKYKFYKPEKSKKQYLRVEHELKNNLSWPKLNKELPILPLTPSVENIINVPCSKEQPCLTKSEENVDNRKLHQTTESNNDNNGLYAFDNYTFVDDEVTSNTNMITKF